MNNLVYIVMDSCRYDAFVSADTPNIDKIGEVEKRFSYASWTSPSHFVMLMGLTHHKSPRGIFASEIYKEDFQKWCVRLNIADLDFKSFVPELSLPGKLQKLDYRTVGMVSLPVLNPYTSFSNYFDNYKLMDNHNDFRGMIDQIKFDNDQSSFYFLNLGETHYPYMLTGGEMPILHGVHGVFKNLNSKENLHIDRNDPTTQFFNKEILAELRNQQIKAVEYVDKTLGLLYEKCPSNTYFIITADHGELFGEEGYFGHGPIFHPKVFEVPFIEGTL